jgi:hypothetical protein
MFSLRIAFLIHFAVSLSFAAPFFVLGVDTFAALLSNHTVEPGYDVFWANMLCADFAKHIVICLQTWMLSRPDNGTPISFQMNMAKGYIVMCALSIVLSEVKGMSILGCTFKSTGNESPSLTVLFYLITVPTVYILALFKAGRDAASAAATAEVATVKETEKESDKDK